MRILYHYFLLTVFLLFNVPDVGASRQLFAIHPVIYPYPVEPMEYPEYSRRPYPALSWSDFDHRTQFVAGRNVPSNETELADVPGLVYRPGASFLKNQEFTGKLQYIGKHGMYLHNIGGYGPGSPFYGSFGEYIVPEWQTEQIRKHLGHRFTGFDVGEQDGRFNFTYKQIMEPYIPDRRRQYLASQPYFDRVAADLGNWCSSLSVLWYWHYILKEGYTILAGAETQNKITNGQVQYMHLRGAGKQYGILWFGDVSVFDTWGYKNYSRDEKYERVNKGGSLSLFKRSYYTQYMYNATILSMESGWCEGHFATNKGELTPIGKMHTDCANFVEKYGQPGCMVTQIALLNDFYSGWMPADHIAGRFQVWNGMDYEAGDFLTDAMISLFFPNYERSGFFHDETGAMCATPYGENADVLHSDARVEVMKQYPVMVAAGNLFSGGMELADKVKEYVHKGGTFIVTAENAARIWPEWKIGKSRTVPAGGIVRIGENELVERGNFELYRASLPDEAHVLAMIGGEPVAVNIPVGKGQIILSLTAYGLNAAPLEYNKPPTWMQGGFNTFLGRPYSLLNHFRSIVDAVFKSVQLFEVGEGLGVIVNYLEEGKYRLAIYNNTLESLPFSIRSKIGRIKSIDELSTGDKLFQAQGYWPNGIRGDMNGKDNDSYIFGGDIRLFDVSVDEERVELAEKIQQAKPVSHRLLVFDDILFTKETIRYMPTFFDYFSGISVEGDKLLQADSYALKEQNKWFCLQKLQITADLRKGFASGRWTFDSSLPQYKQTLIELKEIADKLSLLYGEDVLFIPSTPIGFSIPSELAGLNFQIVKSLGQGMFKLAGDGYELLDTPSLDWETVYGLLKNKLPAAQHISGGQQSSQQHVLPDNRNHILALDRYSKGILKDIDEIDCFYNAFGGVCVSAEYLANYSLDALREEKKLLDERGISMVVSFIEEINHFPGLTLCDAVPEYYEKSMDYYKRILDKMGELQIGVALFTTHGRVESDKYPAQKVYVGMKKTFRYLSEYGEKRGVRLLLTNTRFRIADTVDKQIKMIREIGESNIGIALNLNHLSESESDLYVRKFRKQLRERLGAVILGGPVSYKHSEYLPVPNSDKSVRVANDLEGVLLIDKVYPLDRERVYKDCQYMGWIKE